MWPSVSPISLRFILILSTHLRLRENKIYDGKLIVKQILEMQITVVWDVMACILLELRTNLTASIFKVEAKSRIVQI
jgi:hypothetical protein